MIDPAEITAAHETLDPADLEGLRTLAHRMVDDAFDDLAQLPERPVWRPMPEALEASFEASAPRTGVGAEAAYDQYRSQVVPYLMGNDHPRFWGWYVGNGTMVGALGAFLAAASNPNLGGGNHAAVRVEQQVLRWCAELLGFPLDAGGLMVGGASMANLVGWTVARHVQAGVDVRAEGVAAVPEPAGIAIALLGLAILAKKARMPFSKSPRSALHRRKKRKAAHGGEASCHGRWQSAWSPARGW